MSRPRRSPHPRWSVELVRPGRSEARRGLAALLYFIRSRWKLLAILFLGIVAPLAGFGVLAADILDDGLPWDEPILRWAHGLTSGPLDQFMAAFTYLGYGWAIIPFTIVFGIYLVLRGHRGQFIFFALSEGERC